MGCGCGGRRPSPPRLSGARIANRFIVVDPSSGSCLLLANDACRVFASEAAAASAAQGELGSTGWGVTAVTM